MFKLSVIISVTLTHLIGLSYCSLSTSTCDVNKFKPIRNFNISMLKGNRYTLYRYKNGEERNTVCEISKFTKLPDGTTCLLVTSYFKNETFTNTEPSAIVTDPTSDTGKIVAISWNPVNVYYVVYTDNKNFIFYSACIDGEEYLYIDCIEQYPSDEVVEGIKKGIKKLKLDKSKMTRMCLNPI